MGPRRGVQESPVAFQRSEPLQGFDAKCYLVEMVRHVKRIQHPMKGKIHRLMEILASS
jgi:hypothetical protein